MFMIFNNVPVKFNQLHIIMCDWVNNLFMQTCEKNSQAQFAFVYFSYEPDFEYLYLSVKSLVETVNENQIKAVYLFVDQKAPFDSGQLKELENICPKIVFKKVFDFSWASTETTLAEISSFTQVIEDTLDHDLIVKVDSDIVFFKNQKLKRILKSKYNAIGDGHHLDYRYAQGGMYMIRRILAKQVFHNIEKSHIKQCEKQCGTKGEDRVISTLLKNNGTPFYLTRLMLFPDEYSRIFKLNRFLRWEFCSGHFVKDKENMGQYTTLFNE